MQNDEFRIIEATCCHQTDPLGIDSEPVFSWKMASPLPGDRQTAWRITVTADGAAVWDSGRVEGDRSLSVPYAGAPLRPRTCYQWQVTAWNSRGRAAQSALCRFETAKREEPWQARWISAPWSKLDRDDEAAPYLRRTFEVTGTVRQARLYICGLGLYEAWIEGRRVSDLLLDPAYTKYDAEALYRVLDVTEYLPRGGTAALGVILGNGWYNCFTKDAWNAPQSTWRGVPRLLCELHIRYADGTEACICSDEAWQAARGPIVFNSIRSGEHYDARRELPHWCEGSGGGDGWQRVVRQRRPGGRLKAAEGAPIRAVETLAPVRSDLTDEGRRIFDFGQNTAGKGELVARGPAGSEFILRYAEELTPDGRHVDQSHLRCFIREGEFQTDRYIKKTDDPEVWSCRFVYHGFRYIELETVGARADEADVSAVVMHSNLARTGAFTCSEEGLNTIQRMCLWSSRSNLMGLPTSDPHREKNAWTGDNGFASEQLLLNFDSLHLLTRWLDSVCDCQRADGAIPCVCPSTGWGFNWGNGPDWSLVLTALPWKLYQRTGDRALLEKYYPHVARHFDFMRSMAVDGIVDYGIGDWCAPFEGAAVSVNMESFKAPTPLTDTACFYEAACLLEKMSAVLGRENPYTAYREEIRRAILDRFVGEDLAVAGDCQTSDGCVAWNHLLPPELEERLAGRLAQRIERSGFHLDFGVLGQRYVMETLGDHGHLEVLYRMLCQDTYPSYLYLARSGCTTLTECWNLGGSHNHMMFSHVSAILYRYIAGLREAGPGRFTIAPSLLTDTLSCHYETPHGTLAVAWNRQGGAVTLTVRVPFGTCAELLPPACVRQEPVRLGGGTHRLQWTLEH